MCKKDCILLLRMLLVIKAHRAQASLQSYYCMLILLILKFILLFIFVSRKGCNELFIFLCFADLLVKAILVSKIGLAMSI